MIQTLYKKALTLVCSVIFISTYGQDSFSSGGDISSAGGSVSLSVGQLFYATLTAPSGSIQEGVQQHSADLASLTTTSPTAILSYTAELGGNIIYNGGSNISAKGVVYHTNPNPDLSHSFTVDGTGSGSFTSSLSGLSPSTTYYARAYATNAIGTAYGNEVMFTTASYCDTVNSGQIFSVTKIGNPKSYRVNFNTASASAYRLQIRSESDTAWRTSSTWTDPTFNFQLFLALSFGEVNSLRLGHFDGSNWTYGCPFNFDADCKPMTASAVETTSPFCAGDSALLKVNVNGGHNSKTFLWSTGETTRFIYGQQGQNYTVTVTDESGCTATAAVTASSVNSQNAPSNFILSKPNAVTFTGNWTPATLESGVSLIGYRMIYRQAGVGAPWSTTPLTTSTTATVDFTSSGLPNANYEFTVFARVNDNGSIYNSENACLDRKFYNGSGNKMIDSDNLTFTWNIYPNPTSSSAYLRADTDGRWRVLGMDGKYLFNGEYAVGTEQQIDLSALSKGVYLFEWESELGLETKRIIRN